MPPKVRSKMIAGWAWFVAWWLKVCCGLTHTIEGEENIPDDPCVFASNHQSTWETITTQIFLPGLAWVLKKELFRIPVFGWGLWATRPIAIDRQERSTALEQVVKQGQQKIKQGRHVLIFPEGTRTEDGQLQPGRPGIGYLVEESQCQVIPVYISGTFKVLPMSAKWPRLFPVSVSFGKSIDFPKNDMISKKQEYEQIGRSVMEHVAQVGGTSSPYHDMS